MTEERQQQVAERRAQRPTARQSEARVCGRRSIVSVWNASAGKFARFAIAPIWPVRCTQSDPIRSSHKTAMTGTLGGRHRRSPCETTVAGLNVEGILIVAASPSRGAAHDWPAFCEWNDRCTGYDACRFDPVQAAGCQAQRQWLDGAMPGPRRWAGELVCRCR